jgi:hypothetical protein
MGQFYDSAVLWFLLLSAGAVSLYAVLSAGIGGGER